jgi:hypothetical protein
VPRGAGTEIKKNTGRGRRSLWPLGDLGPVATLICEAATLGRGQRLHLLAGQCVEQRGDFLSDGHGTILNGRFTTHINVK